MNTWLTPTLESLRPPPLMSLADWADDHYFLSPESSAEAGRWHTLPYQRGPMEAMTDPDVEQVTIKKSARVGATKMLNALIGYHVDHDPCSMMLVQPTIPGARIYSNEEIKPMFRDCPRLRGALEARDGEKKRPQTVLGKSYKGGVLTMGGANSGAMFRSVSRRVVMFDEVDAYPPSAGDDGDPIELGIKRTEYFANRKIVAISTPLVEGSSRITELFLDGDQRRYHVPCTQCGHMDFLVFQKGEDKRGHAMTWPPGKPAKAHFVCSEHGCVMEHHEKFKMLEGGEWIADEPFEGHASFHIWAAYSMSPNASWGKIAKAFVKAKDAGFEKLKTFINTVLGETFTQMGEAPDWERLYNRREAYAVGTIPEDADVAAITCAVDVQYNRWVYEVVGWRSNKENWSIDAGIIYGDTADDDEWYVIDDLLGTAYSGRPINMMAVDSGNWTQTVYNWVAQHSPNRVIAVKGRAKGTMMVAPPTVVEVRPSGKRRRRGCKLWNVSVSMIKTEVYRSLRLNKRDDGTYPPGYSHFPEHDEEFFLQLTGEHLVRIVKRGGYKVFEWQMVPGRENHYLDCRVYNRAAAYVLGLDRAGNSEPKTRKPTQDVRHERAPELAERNARRPKREGWMTRGRRRR